MMLQIVVDHLLDCFKVPRLQARAVRLDEPEPEAQEWV
jgi:hypothetical protein